MNYPPLPCWKHTEESKKKMRGLGKRLKNRKPLSQKEIDEIIVKYATGNFTYGQIAKEYNVSNTVIGSIIRADRNTK